MTKEKKKKKVVWQQYIVMLFFILIGAVCGVLMARYADTMAEAEKSAGEIILTYLLLFVGIYVAIFVQIVIHEGGHLIFGLLTGYQFVSFRVGSLMWIRENGKLRLKHYSLAGTGGQCLLAPPNLTDGRIPFVLYNLGGVIVNFISALLFFGFSLLCSEIQVLSIFLQLFAVVGMAYVLINGIPMRLGTVDNDGYNAWALGKNREALRAFWIQMKANEQMAKGIRLKDMPEEWFVLPSQEQMKNSMIAVIAVFSCNRLMDLKKFEESYQLMKELLRLDSGIVGLHRNLLMEDCIYCELVGENRPEQLSVYYNEQQKKFIKSMKNYPSILRTEYAYALLYEKEMEKAEKIREQFEKVDKNYPYSVEIESERELIDYAEQIYVARMVKKNEALAFKEIENSEKL